MLYECYKCEKFVDEKDGVVVYTSGAFSPLIFKAVTSMVFICKDCLREKGKEKFEKAKQKKK